MPEGTIGKWQDSVLGKHASLSLYI